MASPRQAHWLVSCCGSAPVLRLVVLMIVAVVAIGALAYVDERRRSEQALEDFGEEQASAADAARLAVSQLLAGGGDPSSPRIVASLRDLERDGVRVLLVPPNATFARTLDGDQTEMPGLGDALWRNDRYLRLEPADAASLGLSQRTAMVGLATLASGWRIAVAATAERQRDRDRAGIGRLLMALAAATGLVALFGGIALQRQRAQLELARELAVADVARAKDAELERLSRAATMAALGSGVAHEVATPLGVIVGRAEQLRARANGDDRLARIAQTIIDQAEHVERVVRGLLELARGAPIALQDIAPRELVREASALVEHRFVRANVHLLPAVGADLPDVRCEPLLFKHALVNLFLNACDASPTGSTVRVEVHADSAEVVFVVIDDGEGITAADAARAIEPFFTTKPAGRGTGLGLAIANEIAATHRGTLAIAPRQPRGTRASITIPIGASRV
jgi:two-component system, NtrC family, sensor kinase